MNKKRKLLCLAGLAVVAGALATGVATRSSMRPLPDSLRPGGDGASRVRVVDRSGAVLSTTYENPWNIHDIVPLHEMPPLLRRAFIAAEDRRFFDHHGVDWRARAAALVQNLRARRAVRGASTISEQVVRMLHPRPRSIWSRWVEGFEAATLEARFDKGEILEFYLNQVPYARRRRGVVQAARDCHDRDLDTLSTKEMLALAVLVRSPSRLDPRRAEGRELLDAGILRLAGTLHARGLLSDRELAMVEAGQLVLREPGLAVRAPHFVQYVRGRVASNGLRGASVRTTLDGSLQNRVEAIVEERVEALSSRGVSDCAVLVVDHRDDVVLAWVNAGGYSAERETSQIDAVITPRQPGSTLKPFLYALALEQGWTAATLIHDAPFAGPVGAGLHRYRNYSRSYHGPLRLREALGNSLNVPAVRTIRAVTPERFHAKLRELGFESLEQHPAVYGEGLALGNGEVTLRELVGAYAVLARGGVLRPIRALAEEVSHEPPRRVFDETIGSIVGDILSDSGARDLEFGSGGILDFPVQTAVKTGTSNDYRDAWAVGYSDRYTVGVWMGNLDRRAMDTVSGASGPALVLRSVFAELRRDGAPRALRVSRNLRKHRICRASGAMAGPGCPSMEEWFREGREPGDACSVHGPDEASTQQPSIVPLVARLVKPTPGLHLARDPRIPDEMEAFEFEVESDRPPHRVDWFVDGERVATTKDGGFEWRLAGGEHVARARLWVDESAPPVDTEPVRFVVR